MYGHVDACLGLPGVFTFIALFIFCGMIYYLIESWAMEHENDNINEILVFNEDYTQVIIIYCDHIHA